MNDLVIPVQQKFTVIHKESGAELHPQVVRPSLDDRRILAACKGLLQTGECGRRIAGKSESVDPLLRVLGLACNAIR